MAHNEATVIACFVRIITDYQWVTLFKPFMYMSSPMPCTLRILIIVKILRKRTDKVKQPVKTLIRLLIFEQSDQV